MAHSEGFFQFVLMNNRNLSWRVPPCVDELILLVLRMLRPRKNQGTTAGGHKSGFCPAPLTQSVQSWSSAISVSAALRWLQFPWTELHGSFHHRYCRRTSSMEAHTVLLRMRKRVLQRNPAYLCALTCRRETFGHVQRTSPQ